MSDPKPHPDAGPLAARWGLAMHDWRINVGMTLREACVAIGGVSVPHLSDIERAARRPSLPLLKRISKAYYVPWTQLVDGLLAVQEEREQALSEGAHISDSECPSSTGPVPDEIKRG